MTFRGSFSYHPSNTIHKITRRLTNEIEPLLVNLSLMITQPTKRILPVLIASLISSMAWVATTRAQTTDAIQSIRQQYAAINKRVTRYKKVRKELSGFSAEGGELIAYFDGPAIVKIAATYYGEGGRADEEYYYQSTKLIFVYRKDSTYNRPLSGKVIKTSENRFYFENDRLIRWVNETSKLVSEGDEFQKQQNDYLETSNAFLTQVRSKNPTIEAPE